MGEQMYSADEAAQLLGLQVRTVRNYVREGLLPGIRIGKQYRIARGDLEAFTAGRMARAGLEPQLPSAAVTGPATITASSPADPAGAEASSVIQVDDISAQEAERVERTLLAARGVTGTKAHPPLRVEPLYDDQRRRLRLVVVGSLSETCEVLRIVEALLGRR